MSKPTTPPTNAVTPDPTPFEGEITFSGIGRRIIADAIETFERVADASEIETVTPDHPIHDRKNAPSGQVLYKDERPAVVYLNPAHFGMNRLETEGLVGDQYTLELEQSKALAFHELTHVQHMMTVRDEDVPNVRAWDDDAERAVAVDVSARALSRPSEFVAEVGALLLMGEDVSETLLDVYRKYGGPLYQIDSHER